MGMDSATTLGRKMSDTAPRSAPSRSVIGVSGHTRPFPRNTAASEATAAAAMATPRSRLPVMPVATSQPIAASSPRKIIVWTLLRKMTATGCLAGAAVDSPRRVASPWRRKSGGNASSRSIGLMG